MTDRYQVIHSYDVIKINMTFPSRQNNTSAIGYLLSAARPHTSTLCNWNTKFAISIPNVVMCTTAPFFLMMSVGYARNATHRASCETHVGRRLGPFY